MNRITQGMLIGALSLATILTVSATETSSTQSDINQIKDPYEQCLAYVKMKGLTNVDCTARVESMKQVQGPKKEERKDDHMMRGTGMLSQSGSMQPRPPRPPMGSGAMMGSGRVQEHRECFAPGSCGQGLPPMGSGAKLLEQEMRGLGLALGKLKPEERMELMKMIRTYLESKGLKLSAIVEEKKDDNNKKGWDGSIKGNLVSEKNKKQQEIMQAKIKALKEKQKEYTGHITLMK